MIMSEQEEHDLWVAIIFLLLMLMWIFPVGVALCGSALRTFLRQIF